MVEYVKPSINAFLVCDAVIEDSLTKKKSLIGLFTHLQGQKFPLPYSQLGLYFCITDASGTYAFDLVLMYLNTEQVVAKAQLPPLEIEDRLQTTDFGVTMTHLVFPGPGRYEFRLSVNGELIAQKDFNVTQATAGEGM